MSSVRDWLLFLRLTSDLAFGFAQGQDLRGWGRIVLFRVFPYDLSLAPVSLCRRPSLKVNSRFLRSAVPFAFAHVPAPIGMTKL
jgi:hypothetical protein